MKKEKPPRMLTPQQRGAITRLANLSAERRSEIARMASKKRWTGWRLVPPSVRLGNPEDKAEFVRGWARELGLD
jgi:hypothetical protein